MVDETRDDAPGRVLLAAGAGVAAAAAAGAMPSDWRLVTFMLIPAATLVALWWITSSLPPSPVGTRKAGYGLVAVLGSAACLLIPLSVVIGPIRVLAAAVLLIGIRQRDARQWLPAAALLVAPIDVGLPRLWTGADGWVLGAQLLAAAALTVCGLLIVRGHRRTNGASRTEPNPAEAR